MKVTKKLAEYILALQDIAKAEIGETPQAIEVRDQLEKAFPVLRENRLRQELQSWLWSVRVEKEPDVVEAKGLISSDTDWKDYYLEGPEFRERMEVAIDLYHEAKAKADRRLWRDHKSGKIDLMMEYTDYLQEQVKS